MRDKIAGFVAAQFFFALLSFGFVSVAYGEDGRSYIEEITVTAEKTESSLQSTPIAITAIGEETITKRGLRSMHDVQYLAPNVTFNQTGPTGFLTMRGVGLEFTVIMAEPGVSLHQDGVYKGGSMSTLFALFDLERMEVVRGPQGTLNGRNSTGGSVNVYSRLPRDETSFEVGLLVGDYDRNRIDLSGDIVFSNDFKVRMAFATDQRDGYMQNTFRNIDEDGTDMTMLKASAVWTPSEDLEVIFRADYFENDATGPVYLFSETVQGACCDAFSGLVEPATDPYISTAENPNDTETESKGFSLTVNYQVSDNIALRSISSYAEQSLYRLADIDGSSVPFFRSTRDEELEELSQELTLLGNSDRLEWILGLYYYEDESLFDSPFDIPALGDRFKQLYGGIPSFSILGFTRLDGTNPDLLYIDDIVEQEVSSRAIYGQATYSITDSLRATVGLRSTKDEKTFIQSSADNLFTGDLCIRQESYNEWTETTGKVGFDADLPNDWLLYGSVSTGYRSGGFDPGSCFDPFNPESLLSYEIGLKMDISDTLRVNLAAFVYDYEDYQARVFIPTGTETFNSEGADIQGLEVEVDWIASDQLRIGSSLSIMNSEFRELFAQDPMFPEGGFVNLDGKSLLRAPDLQASLVASYDIPLESGLLTFQGDFSYLDKQLN